MVFDVERFRKVVKMTGERAMLDAKMNNTYIVYQKGSELVREYPDGRIEKDSGMEPLS
ncbi:hypothetical protein [Geomicrobium sp. JCM 19055]|uniref:hypothetical protein n=1 Tax=Geomicrobium sp. JCM 19055 TaxID=1460649 RepID=UPI00045ED5F7|nr:hypothetical protein [Geomicrobium sp. JCM 19055]GAJ99801.1 hypothetical protein JCM19055_2839 [Geomicrobium sp. JCM 19055]